MQYSLRIEASESRWPYEFSKYLILIGTRFSWHTWRTRDGIQQSTHVRITVGRCTTLSSQVQDPFTPHFLISEPAHSILISTLLAWAQHHPVKLSCRNQHRFWGLHIMPSSHTLYPSLSVHSCPFSQRLLSRLGCFPTSSLVCVVPRATCAERHPLSFRCSPLLFQLPVLQCDSNSSFLAFLQLGILSGDDYSLIDLCCQSIRHVEFPLCPIRTIS